MPGSWSPVEDAPFNVGTVLLLTDGMLFAQDISSANWWRLRPLVRGDYAGGVWAAATPARHQRLYFASSVLADGHVFVAGGKFSTSPNTPSDLLAAEIYDPVADAWTDVPTPDGWTIVGDAPCCVLADGTVLLGNIDTGECALFDPAQNAWRPTDRKGNRKARGETWTLLPDGSVLAIDCTGHPQTERFVNGTWRSDGPVPAANDLVDESGEVGPAILRPDGTVFTLGATGHTAVFTPAPNSSSPGTWAGGPDLPNARVARDAPACLEPVGTVLFVAGAPGGTSCELYEFDGSTITSLATQPANVGVASPATRLLLLPNGQVLFSNNTSKLQFFTPSGTPPAASLPVITQSPQQIAPGRSYVVRGRQFNGLSQACAYGDDAGMATNYPLVRLTKGSAVTYCRTYDHSSMGVATGAADQNTSFVVPVGLAPGSYTLQVVANGIASTAVVVNVTIGKAERGPVEGFGRDKRRDHELQEEMFWRDLNEVHLLMDFISGRTDKSLTDLKDVPNPDPGSTGNLMPQEAVRRICLIRFPPEGTPQERASQAELLLLAKDRLTALASPARGLTIAFTSMFAAITNSEDGGEDAGAAASRSGPRGSTWLDWLQRHRYVRRLFPKGYLARLRQRAKSSGADNSLAPAPLLTGFARQTYPHLFAQARRFRRFYKWLPSWTSIWLVFTVFVAWDVAASSGTLQKITPLTGNLPSATINDGTCHLIVAGVRMVYDATPPKDSVSDCEALRKQDQTTYLALPAGAAQFVGDQTSWWHPVGFIVRKFGPSTAAQQRDKTYPEAAAIDFAATVVNVFSNNILPMMFGLLGTLAGVMRSIYAKVRDSTLSPRDHRLSWSLLPLGAVAGLTVGLIIPPNAGSPGVSAGITLSAASLSFLAGYGSEFFFGMLDAALSRIFPTNPSGNPK
jgi:hypothetical protein